ncbi:MAG: N-acetylmuramoyl-L-alanine amidase [candidate division Zixibacteria bacterium]|nr:N-acetylmuramoyl-L-alanine amidase [candidate division Zixibacteria bacterium]
MSFHKAFALFVTPALVFLLILGCLAPTSAKVKVSIAGSYEEVESTTENGIQYVSLSQLAQTLGGSLDWEIIGHQISYTHDEFRFDFVIASPYFTLNDSIFNMTYGAIVKNGQLFVPVETFLPYLDKAAVEEIDWDESTHAVLVDPNGFDATDLSVSIKANGVLVEIFLSKPVGYDIFVTEGNWVNVSLRDCRINSERIISRKDPRLMYKISTHQEGTTGQISMQFKKPIDQWHHKLVEEPLRIQISIPDQSFEIETVDNNPVGPDELVDAVVIDAGHGGSDYGAIGRNGTREKDVTLAIAKELATKFRREKSIKVIMTRESDKTVSLEERASIANKAGADLFISIHANASPKAQARGWNVFFLAPAKNDSARAVAQLENSYFLREKTLNDEDLPDTDSDDPVLSILNEMIMTEFQAESQDFALMLDREMRKNLDIPARGVDQAGFFVLNKIFMPSLLVESAFISNTSEERMLKDRKFQTQIAQSIYDAVLRFKGKYEQK